MSVKISDINIACDSALDQDVNQEIGFLGEQDRISFMEYEEMLEQGTREAHGVCECYNGTGFLKDRNE